MSSNDIFNERVIWLHEHHAGELDITIDDSGMEYIMVDGDDGREKLLLPEEIRMEDIEIAGSDEM